MSDMDWIMDSQDNRQPALAEKKAFFAQLEAHGAADDDDALDHREVRNRARCRKFFHKTPAAGSPSRDASRGSHKLPVGEAVNGGPAHRRVSSAPSPALQIIKATPASVLERRAPVRPFQTSEWSVIKETPRTEAASTRNSMLRRSESTPLNPTKRFLAGGSEASPSVAVGVKKRKRESAVKSRPETEQIFRGLSFFYIPNNDIAPARRLRINKAREFGAEWVQDERMATHFIIDKNLAYNDIQEFISRTDSKLAPKIVNEEYPIDCIRFKAVLDCKQRRYQVRGQPDPIDEDLTTVPASSSEESTHSLQIKPPHKVRGHRNYGASRSGQSTQKSSLSEPATDSELVVLDLGSTLASGHDNNTTHESNVDGKPMNEVAATQACAMPTKDGLQNQEETEPDELSQYITMMQRYKDLPLDADDDDTSNEFLEKGHGGYDTSDGQCSNHESTRRSSRKLAFEDRFACNRATSKDVHTGNPNAPTIEILQSMTDYYDRTGDHWRTIAYRKAISTLKSQATKISTEEQALRLPNIGQRLAQKIEEIVMTSKLKRLEYAESDPMDEALQLFMGIYGVGVSQAQQWIAQGLRSLDDLKARAKLSRNQMIGIEHYKDLNSKIPRREVEALGAVVNRAAAGIDAEIETIIGGSYRRGSDSSSDVDIIVTKRGTSSTLELRPFLDRLVGRLEADGFLVARLASPGAASDGSKWHGCCVLPRIKGFNDDAYSATWRRIDFLLVPATEKGAALIYFTGNDIFNRSMRLLAQKKNMRLNQRGLYRDPAGWPRTHKVTEEDLLEGRDERRIFEILGVKWREPRERWC